MYDNDENNVDIEGSVGNIIDINSISQTPSKKHYNQHKGVNNGSTISINEFGSLQSAQKQYMSAVDVTDNSKQDNEPD